MRHRNVWAGGLALGLGLCVVGMALGQDPPADGGNWFSRLFSRGGTPAAHKDEKEPVAPVVVPRASKAQVEADYLRQLAVCDALRQVAFENDDTELANRAEVLQTRAKDIYVQRTNRAGGVRSFDEERLESRLAPKGASLTPLTAGSKNRTDNGQASAEDWK